MHVFKILLYETLLNATYTFVYFTSLPYLHLYQTHQVLTHEPLQKSLKNHGPGEKQKIDPYNIKYKFMQL